MRDYLRKLNSASQYPSIPTYHRMGERGRLTEEVQVPFDEPVFITEKIDGTNARVIVPPYGEAISVTYFVGSRTELLTAHGDVVANPALGIVETVERQFADGSHLADLARGAGGTDRYVVAFGEVYGDGVGKAAKQYAGRPDIRGLRLFDVMEFAPSALELGIEEIAAQRERSGFQQWDPVAPRRGLPFAWVPRFEAEPPPTSVADTYEWLQTVVPGMSSAVLDDEALGGIEGVVVRTADRSRIAKIRFEDYARTMRSRR